MRMKVLFCFFTIIILTACSSSTQTVVSDEVTFYVEGEYWNVSYIYKPEMYDERKVNWVHMEMKDLDLSKEDINNIGIEFKSRDGLITGKIGDMKTKVEDDVVSFLVGTVNSVTYEEDEYQIVIRFQGKQDKVNLQIKR
ncbi:hypothetical protein [Bacillus infantis]|uniref:hypothetical protein n=1 Tax=Bacillus infantis TaxID=324767 RepID=UPI003CF603F7